ncbi:uncharacterized protein PODANS_5_11840 [Podospora anserina S mat+]|uniref:Podospora anserina S mat+ genomic DNA chromosome 5, supercontig 7 n=1 Tax=Podospora anserina (strain S / ATCC MYA-4624 / DSM 980 / FGSC 10383) TaxID=515849 RepID=B2AFK0_PODAN|nr:uncharacterized protein PODANS_5_11840 [Podospora anserina S mat+]CAP62219.1 unnamed protein product [Podospora anserina S mat+]CDP29632.1 Putative protein of unknown function [Podospora anserina S mat+]
MGRGLRKSANQSAVALSGSTEDAELLQDSRMELDFPASGTEAAVDGQPFAIIPKSPARI